MEDERFTIAQAWHHLEHVFLMMLGAFGDAASIAACLLLPRKLRQDLLQWLAPLEAMARRLIFLEATQAPARNDPPAWTRAGRIANALRDKPAAQLAEDSAAWRVRFALGVNAAPRINEPLKLLRADPGTVHNAAALARRIEALRRLIADHDLYIARAAGLLARRRTDVIRLLAPFRRTGPLRFVLEQVQADLETALNANAAANTS